MFIDSNLQSVTVLVMKMIQSETVMQKRLLGNLRNCCNFSINRHQNYEMSKLFFPIYRFEAFKQIRWSNELSCTLNFKLIVISRQNKSSRVFPRGGKGLPHKKDEGTCHTIWRFVQPQKICTESFFFIYLFIVNFFMDTIQGEQAAMRLALY